VRLALVEWGWLLCLFCSQFSCLECLVERGATK
jgi:hypothetical protein